MKRNKLLQLASAVCTIFGVMQLVAIAAFTFMLVHWHFNKEFYRNANVNDEGVTYVVTKKETITESENGAVKTATVEKEEKKISAADLRPVGLYFLYLKGIIYLFTLFLIFWEFRKVVRSAQLQHTFQTENIKSFRNIGKYFLVLFLISGFHFIASENYERFNIEFDTTPLILMLVAYILAEIFKEGHKLSEDDRLTI
ncbi:MAG: DUF2975 domain-containing protein [Hymenobacteraceae bacterium]|nr:DUF2975 domain-containing protein [Hymenobacteraceae bacterium]